MENYKITGDLLTISFTGEYDGKPKSVCKRGNVDAFSVKSSCRMSRYLRSCTSNYKYFVTLTYPQDESTWLGCRHHFRRFIERARRAGYIRPTSSIFWFIEYQRRGAPHFHLFSTDHIGKHWLSKNWFECVGSGDRKHLLAGTNIEKIRGGSEALRAYVRKYAQKNEQKTLPAMFSNKTTIKDGLEKPAGARWWGVVGCRSVVAASTVIRTNSSVACMDDDFKKQLDLVINHAFKYERVKYFTYQEARCFEFKDKRTARYVYYLINQHRELKLCLLSAHTSQIVQNHVLGMRKRSFGWDVMQYQMAKAISE